MQGLWKPHEEQTVNQFSSMAMIGSAAYDLSEHEDRLHSFGILAGLLVLA